MPITDWNQLESGLARPKTPPPNTARVFAVVAPASPVGQPKAKTYSSTAELDDDGWTAGQAGRDCMATIFSQTPFGSAVSNVVMIRREPAVAEVWTVDLVSTDDDTYRLKVGSITIAEVVAVGNTDIQIRDGLIADLVGTGYTGNPVDNDTLTVTNDNPGVPFVLSGEAVGTPANAPDVGLGPTTPAVGVYADLEAAYKIAPFWGILLPGAADYDLDESRRWCEADTTGRRNFTIAQNSDAGVFDPLDFDNLALYWAATSASRATLCSHPVATEYFAAAMVGVLGGTFPGARAWHKVAVSGLPENTITPDRSSSDTQTAKARFVLWSERFFGPFSDLEGVSSANIATGNFIFQRWAEDEWWYTVRVAIDDVQKSIAGVDMTNEGLSKVADAVSDASDPLLNEGVLAPGFTVTFIPVEDIPPGEVAIGDAKTSGAIVLEGVITPKLRALKVRAVFAVN